MPPRRIAVRLEATPKQAFASALDWPGWCRAGRDEDAALKALASYAERYAAVAEHTGVSFPSTITFDVAERVPGGPATAFAAPECRRPFPQVTVQADRATVTSAASRAPDRPGHRCLSDLRRDRRRVVVPVPGIRRSPPGGRRRTRRPAPARPQRPGVTPHERVHQLRQARTSGTASTWPQTSKMLTEDNGVSSSEQIKCPGECGA